MSVECEREARDTEYVHIATYLPMRHFWDLPAFLMLVNRIHKQLDAADGNVAWNARGNPLTKKFYTHTIWRDRPSVNAFVRAEPHATAVPRMAIWSDERGGFADWKSASETVDWDDAMRRLQTPTFYYKKPAQKAT